MTKAWKIIIAIAVVSLLAVVLWEFYQVASGGRTTFSLSVTPMGRNNLFSTNLQDHLENDLDYKSFINQPPVSSPLINTPN